MSRLIEEENTCNLDFKCDISHPIFSVINNDTRRKVLRLVAIENSYGNQLASILNISNPGIHKHIKFLESEKGMNLIKKESTINTSFTGHKGPDANIFEINTKIGLVFSIMPNFVHSQIFEFKEDNFVPSIKPIDDEFRLFKGLMLQEPSDNADNRENLEKFTKDYHDIQEINNEIVETEKKLFTLLSEKNEKMGHIDKIVSSLDNLTYKERIVLRAVTCLGPRCSNDLSHLLNVELIEIKEIIDNLKEKGWIRPEANDNIDDFSFYSALHSNSNNIQAD